MNISPSPFAPENLAPRDGFGRPIPRQPAHSPHSGRIWCLLTEFLPIFAAAFIYLLNRNMPSGQARVYRATQLRTDGVHCRESAGTGPVVLKVVPVTGAAFAGITMDQLMCASLFPHPLLAWSGHVKSTYILLPLLVLRWGKTSDETGKKRYNLLRVCLCIY